MTNWLLSPMPARRRLAAIVLVALAARAITFGNPIVHIDEQFYFVTAHAWLHGALPYVDIWDRKPVGLFLVYVPAAALGYPLGIWAYQAMALASVVATAALIASLADRAGWSKGALAGAAAYLLWVNFVEGQGGQAPIFYNLPVAAAAALVAPHGAARGRAGRGLAAMALVGCALQIKYSAVFEGMFFGLWLIGQAWRHGRRWAILPYGAALVAMAALPTALAWLAYQLAGAGDAWVFANVTSILARRPDPLLEQAGNLAKIALILSPLLAASLLARCRGEARAPAPAMRRWLFGWLAASVLGLLLFGSWFDHYALPLMVPAALCASGFFGDHPGGRRVALGLLAVALVGGQVTILAKRALRGTPGQFAALAATVGRGPGCLYVYSGEPMLYAATGRCAMTRYIFPSHLGRSREQGAIGTDQRGEIDRILARRPAIVVMRQAYKGERPELRARVARAMGRDYRLRALRPLGSEWVEVYERR